MACGLLWGDGIIPTDMNAPKDIVQALQTAAAAENKGAIQAGIGKVYQSIQNTGTRSQNSQIIFSKFRGLL